MVSHQMLDIMHAAVSMAMRMTVSVVMRVGMAVMLMMVLVAMVIVLVTMAVVGAFLFFSKYRHGNMSPRYSALDRWLSIVAHPRNTDRIKLI